MHIKDKKCLFTIEWEVGLFYNPFILFGYMNAIGDVFDIANGIFHGIGTDNYPKMCRYHEACSTECMALR